jgi:malate dehydrogenase
MRPAAAAVQMAEAIVKDKRRILPCAAWLQGEYGLKDLFLGVPCLLGANGLERIVEVELDADEKEALRHSADHVRETVAALKALD